MIKLAYIALASIFSFSLLTSPSNNIKPNAANGNFKQAVVIELFSSEGCSSCPPADALLNKIKTEADQNNANIFTLAFHVDYRDYIGWKDKLAMPSNTDRQYAYCKALNTNAYTPQAVVNGSVQMVGSSEREERAAIINALNTATEFNITANAMQLQTDKKSLNISYTLSANAVNPSNTINFALLEDNIVIAVKRGENSDRTLTHSSVVRAFSTDIITSASGKKTIVIPADANTANLRVVLFIQNGRNLHILNACGAKLAI